ncbi:hypothetical protein MCAMS1_02821 [biofilm metagenome]
MAQEFDKYQLSESEHDRIYRQIEARYLAKSSQQDQPIAIITGGQPGSGKSGLTAIAKERFAEQGGYVLLDADILRGRHPAYHSLRLVDEKNAANYTHKDAGMWAMKLKEAAMSGRRNLVIDQTSRDAASVERLTKQLKDGGYVVEFHILAVNPMISEQRAYLRYEREKAATGYGRFVTKDVHDSAYSGLEASLFAVESKKLADAISFYDNKLAKVFDFYLVNGIWLGGDSASKVFSNIRGNKLSIDEKVTLANGYVELSGLVKGRIKSSNDIDAIEDYKNAERLRIMAKWDLVRDAFELPSSDIGRLVKVDALADYKDFLVDAARFKEAKSNAVSQLPNNRVAQVNMLDQVFSSIIKSREPMAHELYTSKENYLSR